MNLPMTAVALVEPVTVAWATVSSPDLSTSKGPEVSMVPYENEAVPPCTVIAVSAAPMSVPSSSSAPPVTTTRPLHGVPPSLACAARLPPLSVPCTVTVTPGAKEIFAPGAIVTELPNGIVTLAAMCLPSPQVSFVGVPSAIGAALELAEQPNAAATRNGSASTRRQGSMPFLLQETIQPHGAPQGPRCRNLPGTSANGDTNPTRGCRAADDTAGPRSIQFAAWSTPNHAEPRRRKATYREIRPATAPRAPARRGCGPARSCGRAPG